MKYLKVIQIILMIIGLLVKKSFFLIDKKEINF